MLNSKQFARRWRACNPDNAGDLAREDDEEEWRINNLELLAKAHTIGGIADLGFDVVESNYAVSTRLPGYVRVLLLCVGSRH